MTVPASDIKSIGSPSNSSSVVNSKLKSTTSNPDLFLSGDILRGPLFDYCDSKEGFNDAATLAGAYEQLQPIPEYKKALDQSTKTLLQHTAKCDYNIHIIKADEKNSIDLKEDTLYLKKNNRREIQYQFIKPGAKAPTIGVVTDEYIQRFYMPGISGLLKDETVQSLLIPILKIISKTENYVPPLKAIFLAKQNHALILNKTTFTEEWCGQREWKQALSPLQYAAWAGDTPLVDEFLQLLPPHLKGEAYQQLEEVRQNRLERKHLSAIMELRDVYPELRRLVGGLRGDAYWQNVVGQKQLHSVVNLLQWFCSSTRFNEDETFGTVPTFQKFPEARCLRTYMGGVLNLASQNFCPIYRGYDRWPIPQKEAPPVFVNFWYPEYLAIRRYCEVREKDLCRQIRGLIESGTNKKTEYIKWVEKIILKPITDEIKRHVAMQNHNLLARQKAYLFSAAEKKIKEIIYSRTAETTSQLRAKVTATLINFSKKEINGSKNPITDFMKFLLAFVASSLLLFTLWRTKTYRDLAWNTKSQVLADDLVNKAVLDNRLAAK